MQKSFLYHSICGALHRFFAGGCCVSTVAGAKLRAMKASNAARLEAVKSRKVSTQSLRLQISASRALVHFTLFASNHLGVSQTEFMRRLLSEAYERWIQLNIYAPPETIHDLPTGFRKANPRKPLPPLEQPNTSEPEKPV